MPLLAIPFPQIDPVLLQIGPFAIRWYALAYIAGLLIGWRLARHIAGRPGWLITAEQVDDLLFYATLGVVLGGRLGFVLFYHPLYFATHPLEIFQVWQGGMSFHGGLLGVITAMVLFARKTGLPPLEVLDLAAVVTPIGLFFGRIANFINGEL
ncbi:MAG: prolipoprotein diacylglyceryl transferase, partial [Geminicoccaceae bacterium]|nr:prolipoprotein diacylglyceryl transferase [Geminicoccaceae bacterium]